MKKQTAIWRLVYVLAVLCVVTSVVVMWDLRRSRTPQATPSSAAVERIRVHSGGDPYSNEATRLVGTSYLAKAEPGKHSKELCFIGMNGAHRVEISALLWSILAMESDAKLYFTKDQVHRLLPMIERTLSGYNRARKIEALLPGHLDEKQLAFVTRFVRTSRDERLQYDRQIKWRPQEEPPARQDRFLWNGHELLKQRLVGSAKTPRDRWRHLPLLSPDAPVVAIPDFYWALVVMVNVQPELAPSPAQNWDLYHMTDELATAILDYESFTEEYFKVFRPDQKHFLLSMVPRLNHVFPP